MSERIKRVCPELWWHDGTSYSNSLCEFTIQARENEVLCILSLGNNPPAWCPRLRELNFFSKRA